jgi:hypothetical protein
LLNQLAAAWNATSKLGGQAGRVLGMVERVVADVDVVTARAPPRAPSDTLVTPDTQQLDNTVEALDQTITPVNRARLGEFVDELDS